MIQDCVINKFWEYIIANCNLPENPIILDVGCGTCKINLPIIKKLNYTIFGLDKSLAMLKESQKKIYNLDKTPSGNLELINGDAITMPIASNSIDLITTVNLVHLIDNWQELFVECDRCLKTTKQIIIAKIYTDVHATKPFRVYWEKLAELGQGETFLAVADFSPHKRYMRNLGYNHRDYNYSKEVAINTSNFIFILENRVYSSLWKIAPEKHIIALNEVKQWFNDNKDKTAVLTTANLKLNHYFSE